MLQHRTLVGQEHWLHEDVCCPRPCLGKNIGCTRVCAAAQAKRHPYAPHPQMDPAALPLLSQSPHVGPSQGAVDSPALALRAAQSCASNAHA